MIYFSKLLKELSSETLPSALCTVVAIQGSTPRKIGAKMIVKDNGQPFGQISGTIGGGAIEHHIREQAISAIREKEARLVNTSLRNDLAMCCGGAMTVFIEPMLKNPQLLCFGAGHIAQALCPLAKALGFLVYLIDERDELCSLPCFNSCERRWSEINQFLFSSLPFGNNTYVLVTTHDHQLDQMIVEYSLKYPCKYLALVGSHRKALMTKKRLLAKEYSKESLEKIICPAGLDIKAQTPTEIALSIASQMVEIKNAKPGLLARSPSPLMPLPEEEGSTY